MAEEIIEQGLPVVTAKMSPKDRDLGFGEKVAGESRQRLLNRDGSFNVERSGLGLSALLNPYHILLTISWGKFIGLTLLLYFMTNVVFGLLYSLVGSEYLIDTSEKPMENILLRGFFFSVQTFATIGYGTIHPIGIVANLLVTVESYYSMIVTALITGLMFARFARPTSKIRFSDVAVIAPFQDSEGFMLRLVNSRNNQLIEVEARVMFSRLKTENGKTFRSFDALPLERQKVVFFPLSWTLVHPIDKDSPLYGLTEKDLKDGSAEFAVMISAMDETYAQVVNQRTSYKAEEIKFGYKFVSIYNQHASNELISIDVRKLSKIERVAVAKGEVSSLL